MGKSLHTYKQNLHPVPLGTGPGANRCAFRYYNNESGAYFKEVINFANDPISSDEEDSATSIMQPAVTFALKLS